MAPYVRMQHQTAELRVPTSANHNQMHMLWVGAGAPYRHMTGTGD